MEPRKDVLLIGYYWPYTFGGHRIHGLVKHFHEWGWHPTIVTQPLTKQPPPGPYTVVEVPFKGDIFRHWRPILRFLLRAKPGSGLKSQVKEALGSTGKKSKLDLLFNVYQEVFGYPDTERGWFKPVVRRLDEVFRTRPPKLIISNYPVMSHLIAYHLKQRYGVPWIADFTDLWSQNHNYQFSKARHVLDTRLEKKTLKQADAIITVTDSLADQLRHLHENKTILSIPNGFDLQFLNDPPAPLAKKFVISYTGRVYSEMQDPEPFFQALRELLDDGTLDPEDFEVRFYGDKDLWIRDQVAKYDLQANVKLFDRISKEEIVLKQRESHLLLLLALNQENQRGTYTSKLYDYLAAKRPILAVGGFRGDALPKLLEDLGGCHHALTAAEIKPFLAKSFREFQKKGTLPFNVSNERIARYSYREMSGRFVDLMDRLSSAEMRPQ